MPNSYTLQGISVIFDANDNASSFETATFTIVGRSNTDATLSYEYDSAIVTDTLAWLDGEALLGGTINGEEVIDDIDFHMEEITSPVGTHQILILFDTVTEREYIFAIGGDPLPLPSNLSGFNALNDSITSSGRVTSGPLAPETPFLISSLNGVTTAAGNTINGTAGNDTLNGTSGNDLLQGLSGSDEIEGGGGFDEIIPGTNDDVDFVHTGLGNDLVDYSASTYGYQVLSYAGDATPIEAYISGQDNEGDIRQGVNYDNLLGIATALDTASNPQGGFSLIGTSGDDEFNIHVIEDQWISITGGDGADDYYFWGFGAIRLDFRDAPGGIQADLSTGAIANDGYGNAETVSYGGVWELRGTAHSDMITGSAWDESFILMGGNDTLDGGDGFDRVRYDRTGVDGVTVNLETGSATGTWSGAAFTHMISNVEHVRGSNGNDLLTGSALDDRLDGRNGNDTLVGGEGDDDLIGGTSEDDLRDVIYGGGGNDNIDGGYGNDELRGDAGNDTVAGGYGADTVIGGAGNDALTGSAWGDVIFGGDGDDFINGGFGSDRVNGGAGADQFFHIGVAGHGSDWVQDYDAAEGDVLVFGQTASRSQFQVNFTETTDAGTAGVEEAFVIYRPTGQILWALVDGDAQSEINLVISGVEYDLLA